MNRAILLFFIVFFGVSCHNNDIPSRQKRLPPLVDITNPEKSAKFLCELFEQLDDPSLSEADYKEVQVKIEAIYLGLEFAINAGFYSNEELLKASDSLDCLI